MPAGSATTPNAISKLLDRADAAHIRWIACIKQGDRKGAAFWLRQMQELELVIVNLRANSAGSTAEGKQ